MQEGVRFSERAFKGKEVKYDIYIDNNENYVDWLTNIFFKLEKILNANGVILLNISYTQLAPNEIWLLISNIIQCTSLMIGDTIIWKKKSAIPNNTSSNKLTRITEFIFVICRKNEYNTYFCNKPIKSISRTGQKYYNAIFNYIEAANNDSVNKYNNATFSSELVLKLLNMYGRSNIVVFDPFYWYRNNSYWFIPI